MRILLVFIRVLTRLIVRNSASSRTSYWKFTYKAEQTILFRSAHVSFCL